MSKTIYGQAQSEIIVKKSRFIAIAKGIKTEDEAREFIMDLRKKYYDARHVAFAYILSDEQKKYSDDGEPSKTAGIPILKNLEYGNFFYTLVAVVRYFGGILLGTGGLTHAYCDAAKKVLDNALVIENDLYERVEICIGYENLNKVNYELAKNNCFISEIDYDLDVKIIFYAKSEISKCVLDALVKITNGRLILKSAKKIFGSIVNKKFISYGDQ